VCVGDDYPENGQLDFDRIHAILSNTSKQDEEHSMKFEADSSHEEEDGVDDTSSIKSFYSSEYEFN
jgi:hypothetical protein